MADYDYNLNCMFSKKQTDDLPIPKFDLLKFIIKHIQELNSVIFGDTYRELFIELNIEYDERYISKSVN